MAYAGRGPSDRPGCYDAAPLEQDAVMSEPFDPGTFSTVLIEVDAATTLNFAAEQSGVPLVSHVRVVNVGVASEDALVLEIHLEPDLGPPFKVPVPALRGGEEADLGPLDLRLPAGRLRAVIEAERAALRWRLYRGDSTLTEGLHDLEILPFNQWPGLRAPPALLATFVLPNHPVIARVLFRVRERLTAEIGDNALSGYQTRSPDRVRAMVGALYRTVQDLGLSYIGLPASFEEAGQKVRLPDMLLDAQMGNCLDLTVLMAACLEQMGLNPLLVVVSGHAFPAVWLVDDRFPECTVYDAARLRTLMALGDLLAFDSSTTLQVGRPALADAVAVAGRALQDDAAFLCAVDVKVARHDRFRPLALRLTVPEADGEAVPADSAPSAARTLLDEARREPEPSAPAAPPAPSEPVALRFKRWSDSLLDLSLRNQLLNFRLGKAGMPLTVPDLGRLEDALAADAVFEILPRPPSDPRDQRDDLIAAAREDSTEVQARLGADLDRRILHAPVVPDQLFARAVELDRASRVDREEGGANTLFLALGLLKWFESGSSEQPRYAPLLLVPVRMDFERAARRLRIRRVDEETLGNVSLAEKMVRDHALDLSALGQLEADESGVNVARLLERVRQAVRNMPRWEVVDVAVLGLFTFTKFLMWKDLEDNKQALLQSPVVQHIAAGGSTAYPDPVGAPDPRQQDEECPPASLPMVMDADSTQMAAVLAALRGRSFVLQGPPGTGKSQTITNLIAAAIGGGKTVLFVSEKMAALDVVFRRLKDVGVGDYCLELHSNKANKKAVVDSLGASLERATRGQPPDWDSRSTALGALRRQLNDYSQALHAPRPLELSFYQATAQLLTVHSAPELRLPLPEGVGLTAARWRELCHAADALALVGKGVEPVVEHPWRACQLTAWSHAGEEAARDAVADARSALRELRARAEAVGQRALLPVPGALEALPSLVALGSALAAGVTPALAVDPGWPERSARARAWLQARREDDALRSDLAERWTERFHALNLDRLYTTFRQWSGSFFLFALLFLWGPRSALKGLATGAVPSNRRITKDLGQARSLRDVAQERETERQQLSAALAGAWSGDSNDLAGLDAAVTRADNLYNAALRWQQLGAALSPSALAVGAASTAEGTRSALAVEVAALEGAIANADVALRAAVAALGLPDWPGRGAHDELVAVDAALQAFELAFPRFRSWCLYRAAADAAAAAGLGVVVGAHQQGLVQAAQLVAVVERAVLGRWVGAIRDLEPALRAFDGEAHHERVAQFAAADRGHASLSRQQLLAQLDLRRQSLAGPAAEGSEPGILLRETKKQRRHLPIRKLFQQIPGLLPRLKPCLLMSPLSIAQYLPAGGRRFDLVVFDEASQIGTHDAIGAIARGEQVVIVGDSRQLPPTTFFTRGVDDDTATPDDNDVEELESILDEAVAARIPQQLLGWHYRSRHEALIDFSNRHYYDGRLNVFPAARGRVADLGVQWAPIHGGVYEKGKSRTNPKEAAALVTWLVAELRRTPVGQTSFGVVTFSMPQQTLIQDLLDAARVEFPAIEGHFADSNLESVFVKNLENVQGDERDVMLFSICYGPDQDGRVAMNFGPLNRSGGERRLNVAITRARRLLRVYSTLTADMIDLSRTNAVGARHLRSFLQYAAETGSNLTRSARQGDFDSEFERQVHDALVGLGVDVDCQVGCGGYRIDLAVLHPTREGEYVLGVECDGAAYHSAATARDRDRLRQQVLEGLGWKLVRIWSTDWWYDRAGQIERLRLAVDAAVAWADSAPVVGAETALPNAVGVGSAEGAEEQAAPGDHRAGEEQPLNGAAAVELTPAVPYVTANLPVASADPESLYLPASRPRQVEQIREVVAVEGPLHLDELYRRVGGAWGVGRLTSRVRRHLYPLLGALERSGALRVVDDVVWPGGVDPAGWAVVRGPGADGSCRDASLIPVDEIAAAAQWVLARSLSLPADALARETARLFGISRLGRNVVERMDLGIELLCARGLAARDGERVGWVG
jgi:very-short-patch-repair endonuclease/preprotein translocase subunit Sec61beta